MLALIRNSDKSFVAAVESAEGYDLKQFTAIELPPGDPTSWAWDGAQFITRPPTERERVVSAARSDQLLDQLGKATPEQMEAMVSDIKDINDVRRVLRSLLLAIRALQIASTR